MSRCSLGNRSHPHIKWLTFYCWIPSEKAHQRALLSLPNSNKCSSNWEILMAFEEQKVCLHMKANRSFENNISCTVTAVTVLCAAPCWLQLSQIQTSSLNGLYSSPCPIYLKISCWPQPLSSPAYLLNPVCRPSMQCAQYADKGPSLLPLEWTWTIPAALEATLHRRGA